MRDVAVGDDRRRLEVAPGAEVEREPRVRACAQVSGLAEPAGWPCSKPIEAVVGSVPNGDAASAGSSHTCSGSRPWPEVILRIAVSSVRRRRRCRRRDVVLAALARQHRPQVAGAGVGRRPTARRWRRAARAARLVAVAVAVDRLGRASSRSGRSRGRSGSCARSSSSTTVSDAWTSGSLAGQHAEAHELEEAGVDQRALVDA